MLSHACCNAVTELPQRRMAGSARKHSLHQLPLPHVPAAGGGKRHNSASGSRQLAHTAHGRVLQQRPQRQQLLLPKDCAQGSAQLHVEGKPLQTASAHPASSAARGSDHSVSHPATRVSREAITPSSGRRHSASKSAYTPPWRSTTM